VSVTPVILPKLGLTMDVGRLIGWLKKEGDRIEAGEILFEVETDKSTMEVESPVSGYVRRLLAAPGDLVPVAQVIALIATTADEPVEVPAAAPPPAAVAPVSTATAWLSSASNAATMGPIRSAERSSPAARRASSAIGLEPGPVLVHELHRHRAFADCCGASLRGS